MTSRQTEQIKGEVIGKMTEELKRGYARKLARILINQYGIEKCKIILKEINEKS